MPRAGEIEVVCTALERRYGSPRHGNPMDPLDDLFFVLLSNRTSAQVAARVFESLKQRVGSWDELPQLALVELRGLLATAGLARKRAGQLTGIVARLKGDFGYATLRPLSRWTDEAAESYLVTLPGVSDKVAKCVLMYTLGRQVLPVDVHVHRITRRLGWHEHKRADQSHETLEAIVPAPLRYGFHVNCIAHGRLVCQPGLPVCGACVVREQCSYYLAGNPAKEVLLPPESGRIRRVAEPRVRGDRQL